MKNHIKVNGRLLQTNKKWSQLKLKQKEFIYKCIKEEYNSFVQENKRIPNKKEKIFILDKVYSIIQERDIWIPYNEVKRFYQSKIVKLNKLCS